VHSKVHTENLKERKHFENQGVDRKIILIHIKESFVNLCTGVIWRGGQ
jgi:hypothetical protein